LIVPRALSKTSTQRIPLVYLLSAAFPAQSGCFGVVKMLSAGYGSMLSDWTLLLLLTPLLNGSLVVRVSLKKTLSEVLMLSKRQRSLIEEAVALEFEDAKEGLKKTSRIW
jgi:hypothetical protein